MPQHNMRFHASRRDADHHRCVDPWVETHGYPHRVAPRPRIRHEVASMRRHSPLAEQSSKVCHGLACHGRGAISSKVARGAFPGRGATIEGSRGFQPTVWRIIYGLRRGATPEAGGCHSTTCGFMRRAATRAMVETIIRGLKPTATVTRSRRDRDAARGAVNGTVAYAAEQSAKVATGRHSTAGALTINGGFMEHPLI